MQKVVAIGDEARFKVFKGANYLADAVKSTLGPYGRNAILAPKGGGAPRITNDGVTIAAEIQLPDELEDLGVRTLREAAIRTNDEAGDGTTTAITFAQAVLKAILDTQGHGNVVGSNMSVIALKDKVKSEAEFVIQKLKDMAVPIENREQLIKVANVSVENEALAELIGGAQWDVGKDGTLICEDSNDKEDSVERIQGVRIDNGYASSLAINNQEKQTLELKNVRVILTNHTFLEGQGLKPIMEVGKQLASTGVRHVILMARAFSEDAIRDCQENAKLGFNIYPINAPYTNQREVMLDLQATLGAKFINTVDEHRNLETMQLSDVGFASHVNVSRWSAIFVGEDNEYNQKNTADRIEVLKAQYVGASSEFEKKHIQERIAQMQNGFGIVKVTGASITERQYKLDKVEDAVNAVRSALQEGVVPGGGMALKIISDELPDDSILKNACKVPYTQIMANAGEVFEIPEHVQDPVKVVRIAVEKACSIASQLATINVASDWKKDEVPDWLKK